MSLVDKLADRHQRLHRRHEASFTGHAISKIIVEGDAAYLRSRTGQITWAATLNLLARLYKGIDEFCIAIEPGIERLSNVLIPNTETDLRQASLRLLANLNPNHYRVGEGHPPNDPSDWVVVRVDGGARADSKTVSIAARGWRAFINDDRWRYLEPDGNPLGGIVAACLGVAAVYKKLYPLKEDSSDSSLIFSAYDHSVGLDGSNPPLGPIDLPKT